MWVGGHVDEGLFGLGLCLLCKVGVQGLGNSCRNVFFVELIGSWIMLLVANLSLAERLAADRLVNSTWVWNLRPGALFYSFVDCDDVNSIVFQ